MIRRPLTTISILGLNYYGNSPKEGEKEHISDTINRIKPNVNQLNFFIWLVSTFPL
jgi:hypothetical protein